ncbi:MAG: hypothetical protein HPY64_13645 [Anaerolineae bacterium]|nr:hypothetical protein [Anaerolineae bacterium]
MAGEQLSPAETFLTRRNLLLALCLVVLLTGVYWFTYSGRFLSNDETAMFDAAESLARRGNTRQTYTFNLRVIRDYTIAEQPNTPLADSEPLQLILAGTLFALAERLPGIGMVHTVWLLNILVCAAAGGVLFLYARLLGYSERTAAAGALLFGLGTVAWPYSKVFFREPLMLLLLLSAALCLTVWRSCWHTRRGGLWLAGFACFFLLALLTKEAALLSVPIYLVIALPRVSLRRGWGRLAALAALTAILVLVVAAALNAVLGVIEVPRSYDPLARLQAVAGKEEFIAYALLSYLFSPGRGLFTFSPVLLLGIPGIVILIRERRWREALVPLTTLLVFVVGYAVLRHEHWYGGLAWGPRYLVPATPLLMLAVLPALEKAKVAQLGRIVVAILALLSVWVQLNGVLISQAAYYEALKQYAGAVAWREGTWQLALTPLGVIPGLLWTQPLDFAWLRVAPEGYVLAALATLLAVGSGAALRYWLRREAVPRRGGWLTVVALLLGMAAALYGGLRSIYRDPAYMGDFQPLNDLAEQLPDYVREEDILVLASPEYQYYIMNYYRGRALVYTLPMAPGERPSPEQPPVITSNNPDVLLEPRYTIFLDTLPEYTGRVWLLANNGPFTTFAVRPVEWYMTRHYFPLQTVQTADLARLVAFDVNADAPPDQAMRWPDHAVEARFGGVIALVGYDLPAPRQRIGPYAGPDPEQMGYRPGEVIPLSLLWRAAQTPERDFNIGVFVIGPAGTVVEQHGTPQGTFRPMTTWRPGEYIRDNHGLVLPGDLPPGQYDIWVKVYDWQTGIPLPVTGSNSTQDGQAAYLTTIVVEG